MEKKSNKELVLEMIQNTSKYVSEHIQNENSRHMYADTMMYFERLIRFYPADYDYEFTQGVVEPFISYKLSSSIFRDKLSKSDKKYFDLAIDHCTDIINSIDRRFNA